MKEDYMCPPSPLQGSSGKQGSSAHPVAMRSKNCAELAYWLALDAETFPILPDNVRDRMRAASAIVASYANRLRYAEKVVPATQPHSDLPQSENTTFPRSGAAVTEGN